MRGLRLRDMTYLVSTRAPYSTRVLRIDGWIAPQITYINAQEDKASGNTCSTNESLEVQTLFPPQWSFVSALWTVICTSTLPAFNILLIDEQFRTAWSGCFGSNHCLTSSHNQYRALGAFALRERRTSKIPKGHFSTSTYSTDRHHLPQQDRQPEKSIWIYQMSIPMHTEPIITVFPRDRTCFVSVQWLLKSNGSLEHVQRCEY